MRGDKLAGDVPNSLDSHDGDVFKREAFHCRRRHGGARFTHNIDVERIAGSVCRVPKGMRCVINASYVSINLWGYNRIPGKQGTTSSVPRVKLTQKKHQSGWIKEERVSRQIENKAFHRGLEQAK